jgi:hypothetical protein
MWDYHIRKHMNRYSSLIGHINQINRENKTYISL